MALPKKYNIATHILTTGRDLISRHIEYIFNAICHHHAPDLINSINLNPDSPKGFGTSMGSAKAISINLVRHFTHALNQSKECPQYSVRGLLILELINTCLHEVKHILLKNEPGITDDSDTQYQEDEAEKFEVLHRWNTAKYVNVEVSEFGPVLDSMMAALYKELTDARENGTMDDWQEQQLYMMDNGILYHDTRTSILLKSVFDFFHYFSKNKEDWDRSLIPVFIEEEEVEISDTPVEAPVEVEVEENLYPQDEDIFSQEKPHPTVTESEWNPTHSPALAHLGVLETGPTVVPDGFDPFLCEDMGDNNYCSDDSFDSNDNGAQYDMSSMDSEMDVPMSAKEMEKPPVQAAPERAISAEAQALTNITQIVMHRLFNHIYSKCGWNNIGGFDNPAAILDPVNINDIEGASDLFTHADTVDASGKYTPEVPTNGFLRGLISKDGLPMYKLQLTAGDQTHKRTFIPQNPAKTDDAGKATAWAKKVMTGYRLAMLLPDFGSPKLYVETTPGQVLGQEKLTICKWTNK